MSTAANRLQEHRQNPFFVLELLAGASRNDVERAGAKVLALLAAGVAGADRYETPLGPAPRDAELVRASLARLRDPDKRLRDEWWADGLRAP